MAFLLGKTKLEKELQRLSLAPDVAPLQSGDVVLRGVPQALADRVSEILLEITPENQIVRIVIQEVDGAATEYRFSGSNGGCPYTSLFTWVLKAEVSTPVGGLE